MNGATYVNNAPMAQSLFCPQRGKKCPYSELFWSVFSRIRTEYGEIIDWFLYDGNFGV